MIRSISAALFLAATGFHAPLAASTLLPQEPATAQPTAPTPPSNSPFLWRIEGHGTSAYIYGTIHLTDDRVLSLPASVEKAFVESDAFFAEIEATEASAQAVQRAAMLEPGVDMGSLVDAATWGRIDTRMASKGVDPMTRAAIKRMEPWAISALLPTLDYFDDQLKGKAPLDKALYQRAQDSGKRVAGLETVEEQLSVFGAFTREEHARMLVDALDQLDEYDAQGRNLVEEMITAWRSGAEAKLMSLLDDGFGKDPALKSRMERQLLWSRNQLIADRMSKAMKAKPAESCFFAVGALHLPDPARPEQMTEGEAREFATKKGLLTLLGERGYGLTRVEGAAAPVKQR